MKWIIIGIFLFIIIFTPLAIQYSPQNIEGYTGRFTYCKSTDNDYNNPNSCYDISYNDDTGKTVSGKARISGDYYISYDGQLNHVPDDKLYIPADDKRGYSPIGVNGVTVCESSDPKFNDTTVCAKASYYDINNKPVKTNLLKLSNRVYLDVSGFVKQVPYGYQAKTDHSGYVPKTSSQTYSSQADPSMNSPNKVKSGTSYNTDNFDITYHADPTEKENEDDSTAGPGKMWVKDSSGNLVAMQYSDISNTSLYYEPGSYRFGPSNYVPNYEESVYLSKLTNEPTTSPILDSPYKKAGFCEETKSFPNKTEEKCNKLDSDTCASTECCVLLGGQKCVAGNENGPKIASNYSNFNIANRDYYYYKGKCFGNCSK